MTPWLSSLPSLVVEEIESILSSIKKLRNGTEWNLRNGTEWNRL